MNVLSSQYKHFCCHEKGRKAWGAEELKKEEEEEEEGEEEEEEGKEIRNRGRKTLTGIEQVIWYHENLIKSFSFLLF